MLFGCDFPHLEGLGDPISCVDEPAGMPDVHQIVGGNLASLTEVTVPA